MKPVNVCIVVFNRYDLLRKLFDSIAASRLQPEAVYVIDRGHDQARVLFAADSYPFAYVDLPGQSLPAAWNWFAENVPEERILASDDIEFLPEALETFAATPGDIVGLDDGESSHFACFLLRDSCVKAIGLFDETLSPDYLYFEDCDYFRRMAQAGLTITGIGCMKHGKSQSWSKKTIEQQADHHRRFILAQNNYITKWGGLPGQETR